MADHPAALPGTNSFEQWTEDGGLDMQQRASARWKQVLADYEPPAIDPSVDDGLRSFVAEKKASMDDAWY